MKTFYICSYGGCGSTILFNKLKNYGNIYHIHSRKPPNKLEYIGEENGGNSYSEWFNGIQIPEEKLDNYYVIYIYKNPIKAIFSRFKNPKHLEHIQTDINIKIEDIISQKKDLYNIEEFYDNYTTKNENRNYKIICVKYEELFEKQNELSKLLNIGPLNLIKKESKRKYKYLNELNNIYKNLIEKMNKNNFIFIV